MITQPRKPLFVKPSCSVTLDSAGFTPIEMNVSQLRPAGVMVVNCKVVDFEEGASELGHLAEFHAEARRPQL